MERLASSFTLESDDVHRIAWARRSLPQSPAANLNKRGAEERTRTDPLYLGASVC